MNWLADEKVVRERALLRRQRNFDGEDWTELDKPAKRVTYFGE